jgi:hypothetical protein
MSALSGAAECKSRHAVEAHGHCKLALRLRDWDLRSLSAKGEIYLGGNMQDLVNRLQSAQDLTQQLLVRL